MSTWLSRVPRNQEISPINNIFQQMLDDAFDFRTPSWLTPQEKPLLGFQPKVNVKEAENKITVTAELPGLDEKDFDISVDQSALVLKGEKKYEEEKTKQGVHYFESSYGAFLRRIPMPFEVNMEKVEAHYNNGILTVELEKADRAKTQTRKIQIKGH